jgi:hypothetical protein
MIINGGSATMRNVPDVAAVANPLTGVAVYSKINGGWIQIGGTSVSAPMWAGYLSILNAGLAYTAVGTRLGFFDPTWYNFFSNGSFINPFQAVDGSNGDAQLYGTPGYNAGPGYNNCSGLGTIWGGGFAYTLLTSGNQAGIPPGLVNDLSSKVTDTSVTLFWSHTKGATAYVIDVILYVNGGETVAQQTYITKGEKLVVTGLRPNTIYGALVATVNASGSATRGLLFQTK